MLNNDINRMLSQIQSGGIFTQRGLLSGLYIASSVEVLLVTREDIDFDPNDLNISLFMLFFVLGLTFSHVLFELIVIIARVTFDKYVLQGFKHRMVQQIGPGHVEQIDSVKYFQVSQYHKSLHLNLKLYLIYFLQ